MKAVWIDLGNDANYDLLRRYGITAPYYNHNDPRVTAAYLDGVKARGFSPGIYSDGSWYPTLNGKQYAEKLDQVLKHIAWLGNPPVCVDLEMHDPAYLTAFFKRWRQLRPTRQTDWTLEGMQGGWMSKTFVDVVVGANVRVAPQFYVGQMQPHEHSPVIDLMMAGIPGDRIVGMYDAARLPYRWSGYAFTQGRLPQ